ncbi:hypothetical protein DVH05_017776 [Phytophthora capsici]|nr:hypothetical protein DVH05_008375 [Phytophthora capsici]KAG1696867.1 hypothetical protein DVH05_017776 [Phytophthora capsici]
MAARRETRSEGEAFRARFVNRSEAERQRLLKEYLAEERDEDADFGVTSAAPSGYSFGFCLRDFPYGAS